MARSSPCGRHDEVSASGHRVKLLVREFDALLLHELEQFFLAHILEVHGISFNPVLI